MTVTVEGIDGAIQYIDGVVEGATGAAIVEIESRLRELTPRDTGFAANSWHTTTDENDEGNLGNNPDAVTRGYPEAYDLGDTTYINNGANYIGVLDDGRSNQAPNGMTSIVMVEVPEIFDRQIRRLSRRR